jgi:HPt (histidine-containing phosphotransfer) domain-containing protein
MAEPAPSAADLALIDPDGHFRLRLLEDRRMLAGGDRNEADLAAVIHRLAGAAGTFGYGEVGAIALGLDDRLAEGGRIGADDLARLVAALDRAIARSA